MTIGPQFLKDDFSGVFSGEFSEPVTVSYKGTDYTMNCIFDETFQEYDGDGSPVLSEYSRATFEENVLIDTVGETVKDSEQEPTLALTIRTQVFKAYEFERDGQGLLLMMLKKRS